MITLDEPRRAVWIDDTPVELTAREWAIAWLVFRANGRIVDHRALYGALWGSQEPTRPEATFRVVLAKLRKKLRAVELEPLILTRHEMGLNFNRDTRHGAVLMRRETMPHTAHDFEAAYAPLIKQAADGMASAVQGLLAKNVENLKKMGATPAMIAEIEDSVTAYKAWHAKRFG